MLEGPRGRQYGYELNQESLPLSLENAQTDYSPGESEISFRLSNGNRLILWFTSEGVCRMFPDANGRRVRGPAAFRSEYPLAVSVVPVLGPVEHKELEVIDATVARGLTTHRASRHFRNFWFKNPEGFESFAELIRSTWPGMDILPPERVDRLSDVLVMFCKENGMLRELYWAGFGFQIWCQLLTHLVRSDAASIVVIDEPEIYLHPDVQRQLLGILRELGPDVVLATHSTEIIGEADPSEILLVDKTRRSAKRVRDVDGVQEAFDAIGSLQNVSLTNLARNRRLLYVEDTRDFSLLRRFARIAGFVDLASGAGITPVAAEGFSSWERVSAFAREAETLLGKQLSIACIFDRDYFPDAVLRSIAARLEPFVSFVHFHEQKEIENYLLVPEVLDRAIERAVRDRERRTGNAAPARSSAADLLAQITEPLRHDVSSQLLARRIDRRSGPEDTSALTREALAEFEAKWVELDRRLGIVPGKRVLGVFRQLVQERYAVTLTDVRILEAMSQADIPDPSSTV